MSKIIAVNAQKKRIPLFFLFLFLSVATLITLPAYAKDLEVFVKLSNTPLLVAPALDAKKVATLPIGDKITVKKEEGKFYYVTTKAGKKGYVLRLRTSKEKPQDATEDTGFAGDDLFGSLEGLDRTAKVDESSSSHSVRGLKSGGAQGSGATEEDAQKSLQTMEKSGVSGKELARFQKEGKLGSYAK